MNRLITLTTDFGLADSFVAQMKGAISTLAPDARIIDLSHQLKPFDITQAAFFLAESLREFPEGTIHVAVIDPGVGTKREAIIVEASLADRSGKKRSVNLVGPNNGLFSLAAPISSVTTLWKIKKKGTATFDGRDVFAPTAALLVSGNTPELLGEELSLDSYVELSIPLPRVTSNSTLFGEVIAIDRFGNALTNILRSDIPGEPLSGTFISKNIRLEIVNNYQEIGPKRAALLFSSSERLEIACKGASAQNYLEIALGDAIYIEFKVTRNPS